MAKKQNKEKSFERRNVDDRRRNYTDFDDSGNVKSHDYKGPDRRTNLDRRDYIDKQSKRISRERFKFFRRAILTFMFITLPILAVTFFLLEPEYLEINKFIHDVRKEKKDIYKEVPIVNKNFSFSGMLNRQIAKAENFVNGYDSVADVNGLAKNIGRSINAVGVNGWTKKIGDYISIYSGQDSLNSLTNMLDRLPDLRYGAGGEIAVNNSINSLRAVLYKAMDNPETIKEAVNKARSYDGVLNKMLGGVGGKDIVAAAMLLTMNEFRNNIYSGRPYEADLALLKKIAGNDPEMNKALSHLSPYAKSGIMNRRTLQKEFGGLTRDIILSKFRGEDLSIKNEAVKRFNNLAKKGRADSIKGRDTAAVVARAKVFLDSGDVESAMIELQSLKGKSAQAAMPWMQGAAGNLMANQQSDLLMQNVLQSMGGASGLPIEGLLNGLRGNLGQ